MKVNEQQNFEKDTEMEVLKNETTETTDIGT